MVRWETQVEKVLCRPSVEGILRDGSHDEDIGEDNEEQAAHQGRDTDQDHTLQTEAVSFPQASFKRESTWQTKWCISLEPQKVR